MPLNPKTGEIVYIDPTTGLPAPGHKPPKLIEKLIERGKKTPDMYDLKFYKKIPFFAYGCDMTGGNDHDLLKGAEYLGRAHTLTENFIMRENRYFPIVSPVEVGYNGRGRIRGEMYNVSVEHIITLDNSNSNTKIFHRVRNRFILEDQYPDCLKSFKDQKFLQGFMYIGDPQWWEKGALTHRSRRAFPGHDKLEGMFFQWEQPIEDEDEWGYGYGRGMGQIGFWQHGESNAH